MSVEISNADEKLNQLVDAWCARRALQPLREILQSFPLANGLTDEWAALAVSLKTIRVRFSKELEANELEQVSELQLLAESVVHR